MKVPMAVARLRAERLWGVGELLLNTDSFCATADQAARGRPDGGDRPGRSRQYVVL
ncbi:hypothetical protein GCM10010252_56080 [Streptomyces aureoverticillatus]|nr:hypothetical protein GCM10010252_56080 [Streptomyces aureoverticillatus]